MIPLDQQIAAVEISAVNLRGHVENLAELVAKGRRSELEHRISADRLPALEAAAITLRWLKDHEAVIKQTLLTNSNVPSFSPCPLLGTSGGGAVVMPASSPRRECAA